MESRLRALILDCSEDNAAIIQNHIENTGLNFLVEWVGSGADFERAVKNHNWDIIFCAYAVPDFDACRALQTLKKLDLDIPLIVISDRIGEEPAVEMMKAGACDYLRQDRLSRLPEAIVREVGQTEIKRKKLKERFKVEVDHLEIFENMLDPVFRINEDGDIISANPAFMKMLGFDSLEELKCKNMTDDLFVYREDRDKMLRKLRRDGEIYDSQATLRCKDGRHIEVFGNIRSIYKPGTDRVFYEGIVTEITDKFVYNALHD
ncbi:MAG: PAS domain S-box protein [Candidatus Rifleibacteriota bacterium]